MSGDLRFFVEKVLSGNIFPSERFVSDHNSLLLITRLLREAGKTIVMTTGAFDVFHAGHAVYLQKAKEAGGQNSILVVGVDSDRWIREKKHRDPIRSLEDRVLTVAHLRSVDIVTEKYFEDITQFVRPHISVRSESSLKMSQERLTEMRKYCDRIIFFPPQSDTHSGDLIRKMSEG